MYEIRICVTLRCNYMCSYCSKDGEGIFSENPELSNEEIINIITNMTALGIDSVRLTGGEPFCRSGLLQLAHEIRNIPGIKKLSLVTNGSLITDTVINQLSENNPFDYISVSLDTLNALRYKEITKGNTFDTVIKNIVALTKIGIKTRINYVLSSKNVNEAKKIVEFCIRENIDLKVLDLYNDDENYVSPIVIEDIVKEKGFSICNKNRLPGNLGNPMRVYRGYGIEIIIKDSCEGAVYSSEACKKCHRFPCQLGIVGAILSHDGIVKMCSLGREKGINCFDSNDFEKIKRVLDTAKHMSNEWASVRFS